LRITARTPPIRLYINPALFDAVEQCGHPQRVIAVVAGIRASKLSSLMRARSVPITSINVEHFETIADVIKFDDRIFVGHTFKITATDDDDDHTDVHP
jgi:hypothetical protein